MTKLVKYGIIIFLILMVTMWVYRHWIEFKNSEVKKFISEEADQYGDNAETVYKILHDSVQDILSNKNLVDQVRTMAGSTGMPKERVLVNSAIDRAKAFKYLKA